MNERMLAPHGPANLSDRAAEMESASGTQRQAIVESRKLDATADLAPAKESERGGSLGDVARTLGISAAGLVVVMLTSVVLARALGPEGRGVYAVAYRAIGILIAVSQFGLPEVMMFQMRTERRRPSELAANSLIVIFAATALTAAFLWATYPLMGDTFYEGVGERLMWLAFLTLPFNLAFVLFGRLIQLDGRLGAYNLLLLASRVATLVAIVVFLSVRPAEPGAALAGLAVASALVALPAIWLARRWVANQAWRIGRALLAESLRNGFKVQWGMLSHILGLYSGVFIVNYFLDLESVGYFATALGIATLMLVVSQASQTVLHSWMPAAASDLSQVAERTVVFARHTGLVLTGMALVLVATGVPAIRFLYGAEFEPAYAPMAILLFGMIARGVGQIVVSQLALERYFYLDSTGAVLGVVVSIGLSWLLVPAVGVWGAALGTAVGHTAATAWLMYWFVKKTDANLADFVPKASDARLYARLMKSSFGGAAQRSKV